MIYVLMIDNVGMAGMNRIVEVVKSSTAKGAREIASKRDGIVKPKDWKIIAKKKEWEL